MYNKILPIFFFLFILIISFSRPLFSQDFDYNRAYNDYSYSFGLYRTAHLEYLSAITEYQTYQTLTAKSRTIEATKKVLLARDEVLRTYLTAVRMKLKETTEITDYDQNLYYIKLDDEITWLNNHKTLIESASTPEDLNSVSRQVEVKFTTEIAIVYKALGTIFSAKVDLLRENTVLSITDIDNQINFVRQKGILTNNLERWMIDAKQKMIWSKNKQNDADSASSRIAAGNLGEFDSAKTYYSNSVQYMKETLTLLREIFRELSSVK